jgi:hypothetical protein
VHQEQTFAAFLIRWLPHVEQELLSFLEHLNELLFKWGSCPSIVSFLCSILSTTVFFVTFHFSIVISYYPFLLALWYQQTFHTVRIEFMMLLDNQTFHELNIITLTIHVPSSSEMETKKCIC